MIGYLSCSDRYRMGCFWRLVGRIPRRQWALLCLLGGSLLGSSVGVCDMVHLFGRVFLWKASSTWAHQVHHCGTWDQASQQKEEKELNLTMMLLPGGGAMDPACQELNICVCQRWMNPDKVNDNSRLSPNVSGDSLDSSLACGPTESNVKHQRYKANGRKVPIRGGSSY